VPDTSSIPSAEPRSNALQVLLDSSAILLSSSSEAAVLSGILDIAGSILSADAYALWRQDEGDPADAPWHPLATRGLSPGYGSGDTSSTTRFPPSVLSVADVHAVDFLAPFRERYRREGIRSMLVVPLALGEERPGTITFYWRTPRSFSPGDLDYAAALSNFASAAINQSDLRLSTQREQRRLAFLAEASSILASSLDYETTLQRVAHLAVPHIADWCTVHVLENGVPSRLVVAHADPAMLDMAQRYAGRYPEELRPDRGLGRVFATGESEVVPSINDDMVALAARDEEHLALLRSLHITSSILVPLKAHDKVLGAIRFLAAGPANRHFTPSDVQLAQDLGRRAGTAIENALLHRAVLEGQAQLRLIHAASRIGSWSWDMKNNVVVWSDEFRNLHGLDPATPAGFDQAMELIHPDDRDRSRRELQETITSGAQHMFYEHRSVTPEGRVLWIQTRGTIVRDDSGSPVSMSGISIDVTEQRNAEEALRRTEKLAAAGRLAATVAHEVNNPLESLTNLIFLAANTPGLPPEAHSYLSTAESELDRIAHIVRQTLGFYRDSTTPQPVNLGRIAAEVTQLYRSRAESRIVTLTCTSDPGCIVVANAGELKQVIANLVANALDATPPNGSVSTTVRRSGDQVELTVADTGSGIPANLLPRLFEPFFTTKEEVGTGLGLWVTRGILEKHKGTLTVESDTTPGASGTRMTARLPAHSA
jgi:PAS domain S-box-containing protein